MLEPNKSDLRVVRALFGIFIGTLYALLGAQFYRFESYAAIAVYRALAGALSGLIAHFSAEAVEASSSVPQPPRRTDVTTWLVRFLFEAFLGLIFALQGVQFHRVAHLTIVDPIFLFPLYLNLSRSIRA